MKPEITIVIPNFNGAELLTNNLPSVIRSLNEYSAGSSIIVVDDGSNDNSLQVLKTSFPEIKVLAHAKNRGFADAVHTGVAAVETELFVLLNSDVMVEENIFDSLVGYFDDDQTFSVSPSVFDDRGNLKRHSWNLRQFQRGLLRLVEWDLEEANKLCKQGGKLPTLYASGGSLMVRKSMFDALQGFDPIYKPFYGEDADLGLRAWRNGWASYFEPRAQIVHQSSGAIKQNHHIRHIKCMRRRNRYILDWVHLDTHQLLLSSHPKTLLRLLGELLLLDRTNLKGFWLALPLIPQIMLRRKRLRSSRRGLNDTLAKMRDYCNSTR